MVKSSVNKIFYSYSYIIDHIIFVDPGDKWEFEGVKTVLLTHGHFDHIYGLNELLKVSPQAIVYTNQAGKEMLLDARKNMSFYQGEPFVFELPECIRIVEDGEEIDLGDGVMAKAVFTPGHNPSCITWIIEDAIFTGDAFIPGIKTITNLPGGDKAAAKLSEELIKKLAEGKNIYPGHHTE